MILGMDKEDGIVKVNVKFLCLENWDYDIVY